MAEPRDPVVTDPDVVRGPLAAELVAERGQFPVVRVSVARGQAVTGVMAAVLSPLVVFGPISMDLYLPLLPTLTTICSQGRRPHS